MSAGTTIAILVGVGVGGYLLYEYAVSHQGISVCPSDDKLKALLDKIASGAIDRTTAEKMAQGFDSAGCAAAANATRIAIAAKGIGASSPSGILSSSTASPVISKSPAGAKTSLPASGLSDVPHALTAAEAMMSPVDYAMSVGETFDDFASSNPALLVHAPDGGWPPETWFNFAPSASFKPIAYTPTGRFYAGSPTYSVWSREFTFGPWSAYAIRPDGAYEGPAPKPVPLGTPSTGVRYGDRGIWVWEPGTVVLVPPGVTTSGVRVGATFGESDCTKGAQLGWNDGYLGRAERLPAPSDPVSFRDAYWQAFLAAKQLVLNSKTPLPPVLPIPARTLHAIVASCTPSRPSGGGRPLYLREVA